MTATPEEFADRVRDVAGLPERLPDAQSARCRVGVLGVLADSVTAGAAQRLATQLPEPVAGALAGGSRAAVGRAAFGMSAAAHAR